MNSNPIKTNPVGASKRKNFIPKKFTRETAPPPPKPPTKPPTPQVRDSVIWKVPASPSTRLLFCLTCRKTIRSHTFLNYVREIRYFYK